MLKVFDAGGWRWDHDQSIMCLQIKDNVLGKNRPMTEEDLKFVSYAMAADLSHLIHWNKSDPNYHLGKSICP